MLHFLNLYKFFKTEISCSISCWWLWLLGLVCGRSFHHVYQLCAMIVILCCVQFYFSICCVMLNAKSHTAGTGQRNCKVWKINENVINCSCLFLFPFLHNISQSLKEAGHMACCCTRSSVFRQTMTVIYMSWFAVCCIVTKYSCCCWLLFIQTIRSLSSDSSADSHHKLVWLLLPADEFE